VGAIRLGRISYVNMAPVFYRLAADVEQVQGVPTDLNRRLLDGEIDVAPISSIEYARNAERLRLLPRLCVGSEGAVDSIQLVSRKPLEQVRKVAVTPESATSVVLTKVLLPEAAHVRLGEEADATLLIGDAALKSAFEDPTPHHDLGRLWLEKLRYRFGPRERAGLMTFLELARDVGELDEVPELRFVREAVVA